MATSWDRYCQHLIRYDDLGFSLDVSRMDFDENLFADLGDKIAGAWADRKKLEAGEIVNPDEDRCVGHYWLRNPDIAPAADAEWIRRVNDEIRAFVSDVHNSQITAANGNAFRHVLLIGIGGSALGPQLVTDALTGVNAAISIHFLDNTDPDGFDRTLAEIGDGLAETLVVVTSKSGGTAETRNGMLEVETAFAEAGIDFPRQAVAITCASRPDGDPPFRSKLDDRATENGWLARFELADWIGGRTSITSAVGLLPAALLGIDTGALLQGAAAMDEHTRVEDAKQNAAMLLALMWHQAGGGAGSKDMVILPYCDRLALMGKYLQQLVMESLGKEFDRDGQVVNQGIAVYGNKGSTDQHAYIQQLREGLHNFFATFIEVRHTRDRDSMVVEEPGVISGDFLQGFLRGTRDALTGKDRESITISLDRLDARSLGALIALYERAVSFYASLVNVNAYHQPGVEAGKKAAGQFIRLISQVRDRLDSRPGAFTTAAGLAAELDADPEPVYHALNHLAAAHQGYACERGASPAEDKFALLSQ